MKNSPTESKFRRFYLVGFFIILVLPLFVIPPLFFPPDWGKTIVFRSIMAILSFLFIWQLLYRKKDIPIPDIKKNKIIWLLVGLFLIFLLSTIFSADPYFSLWGSPYRAGGFITFSFYIVFAMLAFILLKNNDWKHAWDISIITGILASFIAIIQFYGLFNNVFISVPGRPPSTMGNPILLGVYLLLLFFPVLSFAIKEKVLPRKLFYSFSLVLFLYIILITGSRATYLGLLAGTLYFVLFYPAQKNKILSYLKIAITVLFIGGIVAVYYVNTTPQLPKFITDNKILTQIYPRLSIKEVIIDPRFSAWQVVIKAIKEKPILGWGPENLAIGFDKYYDPSLPFINKAWGGWWDRAHNILLDTGAQAGIFAIVICLSLFVVLFWQLQKTKAAIKSIEQHSEKTIIMHGIQAVLIGYFVSIFFGFDSFPSYLIFFFITGYILHLTTQTQNETQGSVEQKRARWKPAIISVLALTLIIFLCQYNFSPLQMNAQIQKANVLAENKKCDGALALMNNALPQHSFLDAYSGIKYIEMIKTCVGFYPDKNLEYAKKGVEVMKKVAKIRPLYSRIWIFLGGFDTAIIATEKDENVRKALIKDANSYFIEAFKLAPKHQEILVEQGKLYLFSGDYKEMKQNGEKCIALDPSLSDCYWIRGVSEIYLEEFDNAKKDVATAIAKTAGFANVPPSLLRMVINGYLDVKNYEELANVIQQFITVKGDDIEYHTTAALIYAQINQPRKAAIEAIKVFYLSPQLKGEADSFLSQLGYRFEKPTDYKYHLSLAKKHYDERLSYEKYIEEALIAFYISPSNNDVKTFLDKFFLY